MIAELRARGVRYEAGRAMLPQRLAHQVLLRMEASGDSPDDRVQDAVARSRPVRAYADGTLAGAGSGQADLAAADRRRAFLAEPPTGILSAARAAADQHGQAAPLGRRPPAGRSPT